MSRHSTLTGALALMLLAACVDETPVEVVDEPIERSEGMALAQADNENEESFRARLEVDFVVRGDLAGPNTPITVHLEGVATEDISGGTVEVALPTFAAMKLAGPDKRPRYEVGEKPPVVARWQLPALSAGNRWKQSVEVGQITEKGYYQITAFVQTHGPLESPHVFDETLREAWMFIADGGGMLTDVFDETIFPDRIIPQPGTFEVKGAYATASADQGGDTGEAAASGVPRYVYVKFLHLDGNNRVNPMKGAEVVTNYVERGRNTGRLRRIVPTNGIIRYNCPDNREQRLIGDAENDDTRRVNGGHQLAYFEVRYSQCGDTVDIMGNRHRYIPWANLEYRAIPRITDAFGYSRSAVTFKYASRRWPGQSEWASYDPDDDIITFRKAFAHLNVAGHEYTHALHNKALGGTWRGSATRCSGHRVGEPYNYSCALKEGLADYGGKVGENDPEYWERKHWAPPRGRGAGEIEGNVAALFHDLTDDNNEGDDEVSYDLEDIITVFKTCRNSDGKRDDTADFVWCMENRVNPTVHRQRFPGHGDPPTNPRSTRPSDWDADDIRSTWIQNVG